MTDTPRNGNDLGPFLENPFGERYLYPVNRHAFAATASRQLFDSQFKSYLFQEDTLYIIVGTDCGLLTRYVERHEPVPGSRYLFVELPEVLARLAESDPEPPAGSHIAVSDPAGYLARAEEFDLQTYLYLDRIKVIKSLATLDGFLTAYLALGQEVNDNINHLIWGTQAGFGQHVFIKRQLNNLAEDHTPAAVLRGSCRGESCVILAGGPSLDQILPWVKEHREELAILAISRVCRRLAEEGVTPDAVFAIDPNDACLPVSREIYRFTDTTLFIHAYHIYSPVIHQWAGRHLYLGARFPWETPLNLSNFPITAPTVTNTVINTATEMGFARIILAGVDLCYNPQGYTHAAGSAEHDAGPMLAEIGPRVETNDGSRAETNHAYKEGVAVIGRQAQRAGAQGCRIINPAPHAARIPFVEYLPLEEIALPPRPSAARPRLAAFGMPPERPAALRHRIAMLTELMRMEGEVERVKELVEQAIQANERLFDSRGRMVNFQYKKEMDRIEKRLDEKLPVASRFTKTYGIASFVRVVRPQGKEWREEELKGWAEQYYSAYRTAAEKILEQFRESRRQLEERIEELLPQPDLVRLGSRWLKAMVAGRLEVLRRQRPDLAAQLDGDGAPPIVRRLQEVVAAELGAVGMIHAKRAEFTDAHQLLAKARLLFQHEDHAGLKRMRDGVERHRENVDAAFIELLDGYVAEGAGDLDSAAAAYRRVAGGIFLEDALSRLAALLLGKGDYDGGRHALARLAELSPAYIPQYAELLRLTGHPHDALDQYARYFDLVPGDVKTMLRLARLYRDLGSTEGAQYVCDHILTLEPDNEGAIALLGELGR